MGTQIKFSVKNLATKKQSDNWIIDIDKPCSAIGDPENVEVEIFNIEIKEVNDE